jgi:predicted ribosome quality control (RQC) complex YloA/Tae2 family protein
MRASSPLKKPVQQALQRVERGFAALDAEEREAAKAQDLRQTAEALLASAHAIPKGMTEAEITDPHGGGTRAIHLNPKLSAGANAELYFKRARKAGRKGEMLAERRRELTERRDALEELARRLVEFEGRAPLADWLQAARKLGVKLPRSVIEAASGLTPEERLESALRPRSYDLGQGWELLVGKSNRGNEVLTHEIARPDDVWMHADQAAGSHSVLRHHEKGREPPQSILLAAASIAAFFSKARNSSKVSVIVSHKRQVRRPRKAPMGTVTVGKHRTLMVEPKNPEAKKES